MRSKRLELQEALKNQKQMSYTNTKEPDAAFADGPRENERLNVVALEKQSLTQTCPLLVNGSWANEIVNIAVDVRLNAVALKQQRSSTTTPCSASVNGSRANEIVTDPADPRLNAVDDMLDSGNDIRDEDADTLDTWNNIGEDNDILDLDEDSDMQMVEDQSFTDSDEDADILDADGYGDMQIVEDQSLPISSKKARKRKHDKVRRQITDPYSESNKTNCTGNGQGNTSRPSDTRQLIIFDKYGRPCDDGSEKISTAIGKAVRANCRPAIEDWRIVPQSMKEDIWKDVVAKFVVPEVYKPNILSRAGTSWRNWKCLLRVELDKHDTIAERKLNMPERLIRKREDWERFVDFCNTDEDRKRRAIGKKAREGVEFKHSCGRKGIYRKIYELEKESPTGEVNRSEIFVDTHVSKTINDPESSSVSDVKMRLIKELVEANPEGQKDIDNDAVALVCGRDTKGVVRGMGGGVSRTKVHASAACVETLRKVQQENQSLHSDIQLLLQFGKPKQNHTYTPSKQSVSQAPDASNLPASSGLAPPEVSIVPARSRFAPPNMSDLPGSSCFIKNFKGRTIALGSFNAAEPPMEHVYSLIIEDIFDGDAELFDKDGKLGDIVIGGVINWPKACVESNLPASSCFIRNFRRRTIAFGSFSTAADPQMEHVYSVVIKEIYDRDAELFDTDGKLGDIMIGGVINWPKACIKPC